MRVLMFETYCGPEGTAYPGQEIALEEAEARAQVKAGRAKALDFDPEPEPWEFAPPLRKPNMPIPPRMRKRRWIR